jgi:GDP-L-fucose synthase
MTKSLPQIRPNYVLTKGSCIFIAGHRGMVGSAMVRHLQAQGYTHIITRTHEQMDLVDQRAVRNFFQHEKIDYVILAAAKVGGIHANDTYPAEYIYQNLMIEANVIHESYKAGIERLLFLGSSCIYPKHAKQPMKEEYLLSDQLEPTNEPYAIAKIAGIKLCDAYNRQHGTKYRSVMPTNLYGPNDNYDLENSHVFAALIRKFHLAKLAMQNDWGAIHKDEAFYGPISEDIHSCLQSISKNESYQISLDRPAIQLWGSGFPKREFLHVDDLAAACHLLLSLPDAQYDALCSGQSQTRPAESNASDSGVCAARKHTQLKVSHINIGTGRDMTIAELAETVKKVVGYSGEVFWDREKPDGTPRKLLDVSRLMGIGWQPRISLSEGARRTYESYLQPIS